MLELQQFIRFKSEVIYCHCKRTCWFTWLGLHCHVFITNKQTHGRTYIQKEREKEIEIEIEMERERGRERERERENRHITLARDARFSS